MRHRVSIANGAIAAVMAGVAILILSATSFAGTPTLAAGCGTGATVVGSDSAGKVTLGTGNTYCILNFSGTYTNAPACVATNETNGGAHAIAVGIKTTTTQMMIDAAAPWADGDTFGYICSSY
jgi:hypothetical protein